MNVEQAIRFALCEIDSDSKRIDAEFLLCKVLEKSQTWLKTWPDYQLTELQQTEFKTLVSRRAKGEPVAYLVGEKGFWTLRLKTNPSTLIPRPETELLVELGLEYLAAFEKASVLDLGTGTGAIALAIASERKKDIVLGCDFNQHAVELAESNATLNDLEHVEFFQSDWFENIEARKFNLIVSNPPYIAKNDPHLQQGDLIFEPNKALIADEDGLLDIRTIIEQGKAFLQPKGCLMIEHGFEQGQVVRELFADNHYLEINTHQDLSGHDRISVGVNPAAES